MEWNLQFEGAFQRIPLWVWFISVFVFGLQTGWLLCVIKRRWIERT
ncbi:MAG: hypothetical protein IT430_03865 [Phycisphaerales bacterium]|nr:hypothetical protein [Phycisphaerales bacterium]